jgi:hypothetical protein
MQPAQTGSFQCLWWKLNTKVWCGIAALRKFDQALEVYTIKDVRKKYFIRSCEAFQIALRFPRRDILNESIARSPALKRSGEKKNAVNSEL